MVLVEPSLAGVACLKLDQIGEHDVRNAIKNLSPKRPTYCSKPSTLYILNKAIYSHDILKTSTRCTNNNVLKAYNAIVDLTNKQPVVSRQVGQPKTTMETSNTLQTAPH
ncbi:hypothetical protein J6590_100075, partial [Homalodisca vitripennis]